MVNGLGYCRCYLRRSAGWPTIAKTELARRRRTSFHGSLLWDKSLVLFWQQLLDDLSNQIVREAAPLQVAVQPAPLNCGVESAQASHILSCRLLRAAVLVIVAQLVFEYGLRGIPVHARLSELVKYRSLAQIPGVVQTPRHLSRELLVINESSCLEVGDHPLD